MTDEFPHGPCPNCGGYDTLMVVYGMPGLELVQKAERGEVLLGGCLVGPESPEFVCMLCGSSLPWHAANASDNLGRRRPVDERDPAAVPRKRLPVPTREEQEADPEALQRWWDSLLVESKESEVQILIPSKRIH